MFSRGINTAEAFQFPQQDDKKERMKKKKFNFTVNQYIPIEVTQTKYVLFYFFSNIYAAVERCYYRALLQNLRCIMNVSYIIVIIFSVFMNVVGIHI